MKAVSPSLRTAITGLILGVVLDFVTVWMSTSGPTGDHWSFRGNGALVVPLGLGAAVLAGGWAALSLYARGIAAWLGFGVAIGAAAAVPTLLSVFVLVLFGSAAQTVSDLLTIPAFLSPVLSLAFAVALLVQPSRARRLSAVLTVLAGVVFTIAVGAGFMGAEAALSPGSA